MKRTCLWSFHLTVILLGLVGILGPQSSTFCSDPGTGWHLKSGEIMWGNNKPLYHDPFLALPTDTEPRSWISDQWLSDILLSIVYSLSGFDGLNILIAALFVFTFFVLLYDELTSQKSVSSARLQDVGNSSGGSNATGLNTVAVSIACLLSFKLAQVHFILRPVVFSFILFVPVWRSSRNFAKTGVVSRELYLLLPLLFTLWSNLHPSFFLGLIWLCIGSFCAILTGRTKILNPFWGVIAVCGFCTLLNPYGINLHRSILALTQSDYFMKLHEEWLPPDFNSTEGSFFLSSLIFLGVGSGLASFKKELRSRFSLFDLISFTLALFLALRSVRTVPVWGIVSAPLFALSFDGLKASLFRMIPNAPLILRSWDNIERRENSTRARTQAAVVTLILIPLSFFPNSMRFRGIDPSIQGAGFPVALVQNVRDKLEAEGKKAILFAHPSFGGTVTFYGYPVVKAVIDDRNTLLGEDFYRKFFAARKTKELFDTFARELGVTHVLLSRDERMEFPIHEWNRTTLLAEDASHSLYVLDDEKVQEN